MLSSVDDVRGESGWIVGITGGIACGKSEVGSMLKASGWDVIDTDAIAHAVMEPGAEAYEGIVDAFGAGILLPDGCVNRRALGEIVFGNPVERDRLNRIVHPHVRRRWHGWAEQVRSDRNPGAVIIPLLYEVGADKEVDEVICVVAGDSVVMERLRQRGLSEQQALERIAAQWPVEEKRRRADFVIENDGTRVELQRAVDKVAQAIARKEKKRHV